ncbi:MAG: hypothetical protein JEZ07_12755 [Phycisphaerae bacterium]|nr:hypothetical protein [Phycisphaerae bacterium]
MMAYDFVGTISKILAEDDAAISITTEQAIIIGLIVLASYLMLKMTRKRVNKSQNRLKGSAEEIVNRKIRQVSVSTDQLNELFAALADFSRQVNGQIDTRISKLQILLDLADQKMSQLNNVNKSNRQNLSNESTSDDISHGVKDLTDKIAQIKNESSRELADISNQFHKAQEKIQLSGDNAEVVKLAKDGLDKIEIAKHLGRPVGEIELILSLSNF